MAVLMGSHAKLFGWKLVCLIKIQISLLNIGKYQEIRSVSKTRKCWHGNRKRSRWAFNQIIWRENPSIQPWIFIPYLESLSYPSMCQTEFGPLLEYTRLLILLFLKYLCSILESIRKYGVCPRRVSADMGTENVHGETIQKLLRRNQSLSYPSMCQTEFGPLLEYTRLLILLFLCT
jgi:hypothetical protein